MRSARVYFTNGILFMYENIIYLVNNAFITDVNQRVDCRFSFVCLSPIAPKLFAIIADIESRVLVNAKVIFMRRRRKIFATILTRLLDLVHGESKETVAHRLSIFNLDSAHLFVQ